MGSIRMAAATLAVMGSIRMAAATLAVACNARLMMIRAMILRARRMTIPLCVMLGFVLNAIAMWSGVIRMQSPVNRSGPNVLHVPVFTAKNIPRGA